MVSSFQQFRHGSPKPLGFCPSDRALLKHGYRYTMNNHIGRYKSRESFRGGCRLRVSAQQRQEDMEEVNFYSILGTSPLASKQEIKKRYREMMKQYHPDMDSSNSMDGDDDLATILNLVYTILMDDEQRAEYDLLAGFSVSSNNNPFNGIPYGNKMRSEEAQYVFVDEYSCIGCFGCVNVDKKGFAIEDSYGRARCINQNRPSDSVQQAMDVCPVSCIHWVSATQLTLLEEVMARMDRIDSFLLMRSQGKGANLSVFYEASLEWARRQSRMREMEMKIKYGSSPFVDFVPNGPAGGATTQGGPSQQTQQTSRGMASIINMTRKWRDYKRRMDNSSGTPSFLLGDGTNEPY